MGQTPTDSVGAGMVGSTALGEVGTARRDASRADVSGAAVVAGAPPKRGQAPDESRSEARQTFGQRMAEIIENIVFLRVTTVIGTGVAVQDAEALDKPTRITIQPDGQKVASLSVNMVDGDSTLVMSQAFVEKPEYRALHDKAVENANEVRANSVALIGSIYREMRDWFEKS